MKILAVETDTLINNGDLSLNQLKNFGETKFYERISKEQLIKELADTDIFLCNKTPTFEDVLKNAPKLKYIGLFATGYNNVDIEYAKKHGITVCNAGSYSTDAVAQQTFAYILNHYNRISDYNQKVKSGEWINSPTFSMIDLPTDELTNKTIGIIGYGHIGKRVAEIALAFNMRVLVFNRSKKVDPLVTFVSFEELLKNSDIVTLHCPLNSENCDLFNKETFKKMKDGAFFINTARGGLVDENALFEVLKSRKLSGAAVDVLKTEPMSKDCPLLNAPNLIITPHTSWAPLSTRKRLFKIVYENINAFLDGNPINVVTK